MPVTIITANSTFINLTTACNKSLTQPLYYTVVGEITLVALGPLTNIAMATKLDSDFSNNLKNVVIMGGAIECAYFLALSKWHQ